MSNAAEGLSLKQFAELNQTSSTDMKAILADPSGPKTIDPFKRRYDFADALEIEVARQLNDSAGVPLAEALRLAAYTMAIQSFLKHEDDGNPKGDFWIAVLASRNTWGDAPRGSWPVTGFGSKEYWAEMHFTGTLGSIAGEAAEWIGRDQVNHPDSDAARIIMANISAANRRLRKRAADMGIKVGRNEFI